MERKDRMKARKYKQENDSHSLRHEQVESKLAIGK